MNKRVYTTVAALLFWFMPVVGFAMPGSLYLGVGPGYDSFDVHYSNVNLLIGGESTTMARMVDFQSTGNKLVPVFQAGYWGRISSKWLFGVKAFYKYLSICATYDLNDSSSFFRNVDSQLRHEASVVGLFGWQLHRIIVYFGGGGVWLSTSNLMQMASSENRGFLEKRSAWGGIAQLGLIYNITKRWFLDANCSYGVTEKVNFNNTENGQLQTITAYFVNKQVTFTINRRFIL